MSIFIIFIYIIHTIYPICIQISNRANDRDCFIIMFIRFYQYFFTKTGMLIHNRKNWNLFLKKNTALHGYSFRWVCFHDTADIANLLNECECHRPHLALPREHRAEVMDLAPLDATLYSKHFTILD